MQLGIQITWLARFSFEYRSKIHDSYGI